MFLGKTLETFSNLKAMGPELEVAVLPQWWWHPAAAYRHSAGGAAAQ